MVRSRQTVAAAVDAADAMRRPSCLPLVLLSYAKGREACSWASLEARRRRGSDGQPATGSQAEEGSLAGRKGEREREGERERAKGIRRQPKNDQDAV